MLNEVDIIDFQVDGYNRMTIYTGFVMDENLEFWTMIQYIMCFVLFIDQLSKQKKDI